MPPTLSITFASQFTLFCHRRLYFSQHCHSRLVLTHQNRMLGHVVPTQFLLGSTCCCRCSLRGRCRRSSRCTLRGCCRRYGCAICTNDSMTPSWTGRCACRHIGTLLRRLQWSRFRCSQKFGGCRCRRRRRRRSWCCVRTEASGRSRPPQTVRFMCGFCQRVSAIAAISCTTGGFGSLPARVVVCGVREVYAMRHRGVQSGTMKGSQLRIKVCVPVLCGTFFLR